MTIFTQAGVRRLLLTVGFPPYAAKIGAAVALCEAPCRVEGGHGADFGAVGDQALANDVWGFSYGGFQVRSLRAQKGTGGWRDEDRLTDAEFNARAAKSIWAESGWRPWSTFTSGMYKAYLPGLYPPAPGTYTVVGGDTISGIAIRLGGFTWQDLARVNNLHEPYSIYVGQHLTLP